MENNYTLGQIFSKTISKIDHFEGRISSIIGTKLIKTNDKKEIERVQEAIYKNRIELRKFLAEVFQSESMANHLADKIYSNCFCMSDFYLNFDAKNRELFLFGDY